MEVQEYDELRSEFLGKINSKKIKLKLVINNFF